MEYGLNIKIKLGFYILLDIKCRARQFGMNILDRGFYAGSNRKNNSGCRLP